MSTPDHSRTLSVTADIVASVISIDVGIGDTVDAGQTLLVMESMKMEIPISATSSGTVTQIGVAVGDVVQEGDLLVEIAR
ncbi:MAG TPA: biotin/lipoyl-binding carrier protein [Euzebya sp.]|nr:biotin/lipoyl-binding carrier protein [Euzebya sp.]HUG84462.1 biotin/lipoyl-binding carrier protein [Euzebya sp.]